MKKHILLSIAAAMIALPVSAQDAPPPPNKPCECGCEKHPRPHHRKMDSERRGMGRGMAILGKDLVMEKYDKDKDGKLSKEEIDAVKADVKKEHEARRAEILKKFDKDGDGKISCEERQGMREEWKKAHPDVVKKMETRRAERLKKFDKDGDGKLSPEEKAFNDEKQPRRHDRRGKGKGKGSRQGERHGIAPDHGPVAMVGMTLLMEKYDSDKDGVLSESENAVMKADAKKALEAKKIARKAKKEDRADKNDNTPLPPAPPLDDAE